MKKIALLSFLLCLSNLVCAAKPLLLFTPLTSTNRFVAPNSSANVMYRITNQSLKPHNFVMRPIVGIQQDSSNGYCPAVFSLAYQQSCTLKLEINGANLKSDIIGGPVVCEQGSNLLCYQPAAVHVLSIKRGEDTPTKVTLVIGNSPLTLIAEGSAAGITLTNNSTTTVTNIHANLANTPLDGNVTQDASDCAQLLGGQTCTLLFTPGLNAVSLTSFPILGDNSAPIGGQIEVTAPTMANISVSGSPLMLQATTGTPTPQSLTITNQSNLVTATNISADISGALAAAGVTENASACTTLLPQQSCNLIFTPAAQSVGATTVNIQGTNTSITTASIAVNGPPQAVLSITAGSPLLLLANGATGTITIQNNSTTENALNIQSNFTSTALNGLVTETANTCTNVPPNGSCTLTYTPGSQPSIATNFPIQGSNTTALTGSIEIKTFIIYVTSGSFTGNLGGFSGADSICNSDAAKPSTGFAAGYQYKALLQDNNATVSGLSYYRPDTTTLIATATGGNLVGNANLTNAISTIDKTAWTGGNMANCNNWTNNVSSLAGLGQVDSATMAYWLSTNRGCTQNHALYCVSQ